jgi:arginyl-tRNA synthetase
MDILADFERHLTGAALVALGSVPAPVSIEVARKPKHGDLTSAFALVASRLAGLDSRSVADKIADRLRENPDVALVEVAGPGFLNLVVAPSAWVRMLAALLSEGENYGRSTSGEGRLARIVFLPGEDELQPSEALSRSCIVGDALTKLLEFTGFKTFGSGDAVSEETFAITLGQPVRLLRKRAVVASGDSLGIPTCEIGNDAARYGMLMHQNAMPADLELDLLCDWSYANPAFLVQYAHARCQAIGASAIEHDKWDVAAFHDGGARSILRRLAFYPREIAHAAATGEPHWLALFLHELANELHKQYNRSLTAPHLRFIRDDDRLLTSARLALVRGVGTVLKSGLALLGVHAPNEIR